MSESLLLSPSEETLVGKVIENGSSVINKDNIDQFVSAVLKVGSDTFAILKTVIVNDSKLQKEIAEKISETAQQTIQSNDKMAQKVLDTMKANSEAIRSTLSNVEGDAYVACLEEMRFYAQKMFDVEHDTQASNERTVARQKETSELSAKKSSNGKAVAVGFGVFGLVITTGLILKLLGKHD